MQKIFIQQFSNTKATKRQHKKYLQSQVDAENERLSITKTQNL